MLGLAARLQRAVSDCQLRDMRGLLYNHHSDPHCTDTTDPNGDCPVLAGSKWITNK